MVISHPVGAVPCACPVQGDHKGAPLHLVIKLALNFDLPRRLMYTHGCKSLSNEWHLVERPNEGAMNDSARTVSDNAVVSTCRQAR